MFLHRLTDYPLSDLLHGFYGVAVCQLDPEPLKSTIIELRNRGVTSGLRTMRQPTPTMNRIWIATFPEMPAFTSTGFLETVPMWNLTNESNQNQPFWILLRWGDPALENMVR
jgi:hypothetical protein